MNDHENVFNEFKRFRMNATFHLSASTNGSSLNYHIFLLIYSASRRLNHENFHAIFPKVLKPCWTSNTAMLLEKIKFQYISPHLLKSGFLLETESFHYICLDVSSCRRFCLTMWLLSWLSSVVKTVKTHFKLSFIAQTQERIQELPIPH